MGNGGKKTLRKVHHGTEWLAEHHGDEKTQKRLQVLLMQGETLSSPESMRLLSRACPVPVLSGRSALKITAGRNALEV
ncbi:hypothetical protein [Chelativorans sp. Marseille-P2723]|uniref:hypothetical protein n=1 Tax=Chelativorans sp. Marseille-P2723 TaxID=2709133 RepID=UPI00156E473B|nr:hypothetical protein [Chelativorans sp. Marseille-P2723]